jgi:hypothetical protein
MHIIQKKIQNRASNWPGKAGFTPQWERRMRKIFKNDETKPKLDWFTTT